MNELSRQKNILLIQLFSNGDCLYATAVARQIKTDYPGCRLTWIIAGFCRNILNENPFVDAVIETDEVPKNDRSALRKLKKRFRKEKEAGIWDEVFVTQNMDENLAYYDGCIRTGIFRAYPHPITVDPTPVLQLTEAEKKNAAEFSKKHQLEKYRIRLLFEFAPQSGQLPITKEFAIRLAENLVKNPDTAVILSSALTIDHANERIIDGSVLTLRETAGLSFFCTHLLGCSSGITWITTSNGAKLLPMVQLINPDTIWQNFVSRDFKRFNRSTTGIIDLLGLDEGKVEACLQRSFNDFAAARLQYNQEIPLKFNTSRNIVYNFLCHLQFGCIAKHIAVNRQVYGNNPVFYKEVILAVVLFPVTLIKNIFTKKVLKIRH
jgi:hypothetical protein